MSARMLARTAAIALVAGAVVAALFATRGGQEELSPVPAMNGTEPLGLELARCRALGLDAASDAACQALWDAIRDRFLAPAETAPPSTEPDRAQVPPPGDAEGQ
ncbi:MAG: putative entry exclusion protein TrbK-alt [Alphaproteobacteria bacterium]